MELRSLSSAREEGESSVPEDLYFMTLSSPNFGVFAFLHFGIILKSLHCYRRTVSVIFRRLHNPPLSLFPSCVKINNVEAGPPVAACPLKIMRRKLSIRPQTSSFTAEYIIFSFSSPKLCVIFCRVVNCFNECRMFNI